MAAILEKAIYRDVPDISQRVIGAQILDNAPHYQYQVRNWGLLKMVTGNGKTTQLVVSLPRMVHTKYHNIKYKYEQILSWRYKE